VPHATLDSLTASLLLHTLATSLLHTLTASRGLDCLASHLDCPEPPAPKRAVPQAIAAAAAETETAAESE